MFVVMGTGEEAVGLTYTFFFTFLIRSFHDTPIHECYEYNVKTKELVDLCQSLLLVTENRCVHQLFSHCKFLHLSCFLKCFVMHHMMNWWYISKISSDFLFPSTVGHEDS
jgi:hypothetical protein